MLAQEILKEMANELNSFSYTLEAINTLISRVVSDTFAKTENRTSLFNDLKANGYQGKTLGFLADKPREADNPDYIDNFYMLYDEAEIEYKEASEILTKYIFEKTHNNKI